MPCLNVRPSAPDRLNQLGDLTSIFSSLASGISSAATTVVNNAPALMQAYGQMQTAKAAAETAITAARANSSLQVTAARSMTPDQLQAYMKSGGVGTYGLNAPSTMPSWLLPVGLGALALVLVMSMKPSARPANA